VAPGPAGEVRRRRDWVETSGGAGRGASDRGFAAAALGWNDVSLSSATTAVAASDCYVILAAITANACTLLNATGAGREDQTVSVTVAALLHLLTSYTGACAARWCRAAVAAHTASVMG